MVPFLAHNRISPGAGATYTPFQLEKASPAQREVPPHLPEHTTASAGTHHCICRNTPLHLPEHTTAQREGTAAQRESAIAPTKKRDA
jgi:hypothetical protein